jgi:lipopolysaccharide export system protein LptA
MPGGNVNALRSCRRKKYRPFWIRVALFTLTTMFLSSGVFAEEAPQKKSANQADEQIQIVADKLITNSAEKFADFIGDVQASQGSLVITSERLRIYYREDADRNQDQIGGRESIKRVVASGNVQVSSEKYTAETARVEYDPDKQILVLTGENSVVKSGKNILTGSKISVNRKSGQIEVEGSPHRRVKAVFYPPKSGAGPDAKE